jgi:hypothetical protein
VPQKDLDALYLGPLEEFTASRNELAKELGSDWVKGLAKPSRAAWLVNQLSVRNPDEVSDLLDLGKQLRAAQEDMLAGSADRDRLREAAQREQRTVDSLTRAAEKIGGGVGAQILTRVTETLQSAAGEPAVAAAIERGRLTREQRSASIGLIGTAAPATGGSKRPVASEREAAEQRARRQQAKRRQTAERKLASAEKRLERERAALERAQDRVDEAEGRVHGAELDVHAARRELDEV